MTALLPTGTFVSVTEDGADGKPPYIAKIVGYDQGRTKYEIGLRYSGSTRWLFAEGGMWAFPSWCRPISEDQACAPLGLPFESTGGLVNPPSGPITRLPYEDSR